jgi:hypothetical protein
VASHEELERMLLSSEGRSKVAAVADGFEATADGEPKRTTPRRFRSPESDTVREATADELRYATDRSGLPVSAVATAEEAALEADDNPALSLWAIGFEHDNYGGRSAFMSLPREAVRGSNPLAPT